MSTELGKKDLDEDVATLTSLRARELQGLSPHQRRIERLTGLIARPRSLYLTLLAVVAWVVGNSVVARTGTPVPDPPPYPGLQGAIGLASLMVTTLILITQSRQSRDMEQRAHLDLQVNLLAEQKVAKLISLVEELRRDLPMVLDREDPVAEKMQQPVDPHAVVSALEDLLEHPADDSQAQDPTDAPSHGSSPGTPPPHRSKT